MRRLLSFLLLFCLLLASTAAAGGDGREKGRGKHDVPAPFGSFIVQNDARTVTGEHMSFNFSESGITDFRALNRTLFDLVVQADRDDDDDDRPSMPRVQNDGSKFRVRTSNYTFTANDNPSAVGKLETDGRILLTFEEGAVLSQRDESVRFSFGDLQGAVRGDDLTLSGRTVSADDEVLVFLDVERGSFDKHRGDIGQAIEKRHVGVEATLNLDERDQVQQDVVSYGNVTMTTLKAERGNLTLLIDGHGFDGRVIVVNVDGRVLGADRAEKLNVTLDGQNIVHANDLVDILDPDDDGFSPEYYVVYDPGAEAFQLIVTVPHYSVHTLSVTTFLEVLKPSVALGIVAGVALLVPTALVLFRRK